MELLQRLRSVAADDRGDRRHLLAAIAEVAAALGNTPAVCRRAYLDPAVIDAYRDGRLDRLRPRSVRGVRVAERLYLTLRWAQRGGATPPGGTPRTAP